MTRDETIVQLVKVALAVFLAVVLVLSLSVLLQIRDSIKTLSGTQAEQCTETFRHYYLDEEKKMCTWVDLCKKD